MNERIEKLAEQAEEWVCKNYPDAMDDNDEFHAQTMEKFAELIVRDCVGVVKWTPTGVPHNTIIKNIKQHFGVEE